LILHLEILLDVGLGFIIFLESTVVLESHAAWQNHKL